MYDEVQFCKYCVTIYKVRQYPKCPCGGTEARKKFIQETIKKVEKCLRKS